MTSRLLSALPSALVDEARRAYASEGRAYHTFDHVEELFGWLDEVARDVGFQRPLEVSLAALFHDAVYEPGKSDNEARSAELASASIARHALAANTERVVELILWTARHGSIDRVSIDAEAALFLDADM